MIRFHPIFIMATTAQCPMKLHYSNQYVPWYSTTYMNHDRLCTAYHGVLAFIVRNCSYTYHHCHHCVANAAMHAATPSNTMVRRLTMVSPQRFAQKDDAKRMGSPFAARMRVGSCRTKR